MSKPLQVSLLLFVLLQIIVSASFGLAHDEAYYWLYSRHLDWGYFDHPPMVAWTIKFFSFLPHSEWALRLGFILQQAAALIILLKMLPARFHQKGFLLFLAFPLASYSGLFALPDMPLLFMTAIYCYFLQNYLEEETSFSILGLAVSVPLLLYAKYHGILLIFFTLVALPRLLQRKSFYLITLISVLLFLPHVWWQYTHDFSTLRYHFLERPTSIFSLKRVFEYLGLQLLLAGVLVGPIVWWTVTKLKSKNDFERAMKCIAVGVVVFFLVSTFSKKFEANWTIFLSIPLIYLASQSAFFEKKLGLRLLFISAGLVLLARIILTLSPATLSIKRLSEFHDWKEWSQLAQEACEQRRIVANSYQVASKLSYYLNQEVPALNFHSRKNQFDYWRFERKYGAEEVCYLTDKQGFNGAQILTPEGKGLRIVLGFTANELWALKDEQKTQH